MRRNAYRATNTRPADFNGKGWQKNQNVSISSDSAYDSVAYVPLMIW